VSRASAVRRSATMAALFAAMVAGTVAAFLPDGVAAQPAPYFSSTYAASEGSPYKEVYGRTFGAGAPLETAAPPAAPPADPPTDPPPLPEVAPEVVYVIEDGRLLTYSAADYAKGEGRARSLSPLPADSSPLGRPAVSLPSVADHLYGAPPAETAAGPAAVPIRLVPPSD